MIHLEKVTYKNEEEVIRLDTFESQYPFVADNVESLADAHIAERIKTEDGEDAYRAIRPFDRAAYLDKGALTLPLP